MKLLWRAVPVVVLLILLVFLSARPIVQPAIPPNTVMQQLYHLEAAVEQTGWTPIMLREAGDLWYALGDVAQAMPYWEAAAAASDTDPALLRGLVEGYSAIGDWGRALTVLEHLLQLNPDDAWAHYYSGLIRAAANPMAAGAHFAKAARVPQYRQMAEAYRMLMRDGGDSGAFSVRVGALLGRLELWPYAELAFQYAVDVTGYYPEALAYAGLARVRQDKPGADQIAHAVEQEPDNPQVRYLQGLYLRSIGDDLGSRDAFVAATRFDPQNPAYYAELGTTYRQLNNLEQAERWLRVAVELSDNDPRFEQLLSLFYVESAYNVEAIIDESLMGEEAAAPNAASMLDTALALAPDNPGLLFYKAEMWLDSGNISGARELLARVAALDSPWQDAARELLRELEAE